MSPRGVFITFEGIEGCGKSTQAKRLADALSGEGISVDRTREPGGTAIGEAIRGVLLDPENTELAQTTELLLYAAARAQHVAQRIRPALERGDYVICDRFFDSTTAYQGGGREMRDVDYDAFHALTTGGLVPDLTLLLDLPADVGLARATRDAPADRIEQESMDFHERVRKAFLELAARFPDRIVVIDASADVDTVSSRVRSAVDAYRGRATAGAGGGRA